MIDRKLQQISEFSPQFLSPGEPLQSEEISDAELDELLRQIDSRLKDKGSGLEHIYRQVLPRQIQTNSAFEYVTACVIKDYATLS